jgi:hypothetical protein
MLKALPSMFSVRGLARLAGLLSLVSGLGPGALAGEIRVGAAAEVKQNSIWFPEAAKLARWQALKRNGPPAAFVAYQEDALSHRDAWQFLKPLPVKVLAYDPATRQVKVEMEVKNRMQGSVWFVDAAALAR